MVCHQLYFLDKKCAQLKINTHRRIVCIHFFNCQHVHVCDWTHHCRLDIKSGPVPSPHSQLWIHLFIYKIQPSCHPLLLNCMEEHTHTHCTQSHTVASENRYKVIEWKGVWPEEAIHVNVLQAGCGQEGEISDRKLPQQKGFNSQRDMIKGF